MKVQSNFTGLRGKVYDLSSKRAKSPLLDAKIKATMAGIKKLEAQIDKFERVSSKKSSKKGARKSKPKRK